ncbi:hypothetical protein HanLR1_Chr03g0108001 [Helianthus annuus]|nr:hypothetical protein HanLR1_Chr03g0108001 [Helianthus annuus]
MDTLPAQNPKPHHNFTVDSINLLASTPPKHVSGPLSAVFGSASGFPELQFFLEPDGQHSINFDLRTTQVLCLVCKFLINWNKFQHCCYEFVGKV